MLKKSLYTVLVILALIAIVYFLYLRPRYTNCIHSKVPFESFSKDYEGAEDLVDWYFTNYHIPAISIAIVEDGEIQKYISKGTNNRKSSTPIDEKSIYQIASTSKTITGIIIKSLESKGKLELEKSVAAVLLNKDKDPHYNRFDSISLRMVMNHRSGLGRDMHAYSENDIMDALESADLIFQPGTKWEYSNFGYALLALILEKETNQKYMDLVEEYLSDPYEIPFLKAELNKDDETKLVKPYSDEFRFFDGLTIDFGMQTSASGLYTTVESLGKILALQLSEYESYDSLKTSSPFILSYPQDTTWDETTYYGYGIFEFNYKMEGVSDDIILNLEHGGDLDGFTCAYELFPEYDCGFVALTSSGGKWFNEMAWNISRLLVKKNL